jgi:DnaK suppressor protein
VTEIPGDDQVRATLLARRTTLLTELASAQSALVDIRAMRADRTDDDEHDPDGAPLSAEWSRVDGLHRAAVKRLSEIDLAIARLDSAEYGICSRCGRTISPGRLEVMPAASRCVECADKR